MSIFFLQNSGRKFPTYQQSTESSISSISTRDVSRFSLEDNFKSSLVEPTPVWNINKKQFNVFDAVPGTEDDTPENNKLKITEHVYTISAEDLRETAIAEDNSNDEGVETKFVGRRQFRACHSACVQSSCLPVTDVSRYSQCVNECKQTC